MRNAGLEEAQAEYSLAGLMLKLKLQSLATWWEELIHLKRPWCWERLREEGKGTTEDEMVGWNHQLNGHGFGWTLGVGDGQGGLACCGSWGHNESDTTEWLNWTDEGGGGGDNDGDADDGGDGGHDGVLMGMASCKVGIIIINEKTGIYIY